MPIQSWRAPVPLRLKWAVSAIVCVAVAVVFFPLWFAIPAAVLICGSSLGSAALGATVALDTEAGWLRISLWPITRRVRVADVTAVMVEGTKVSIARASGGEISFYAWGRSRLDRRLGIQAAASDIGHAISSASALARAQAAPDGKGSAVEQGTAAPRAARQARGRTLPRARSALAVAMLTGLSLIAVGSALLVRLHWHNPVMTALAVILALALGIGGLFYLLMSLLLSILLVAERRVATRASGA